MLSFTEKRGLQKLVADNMDALKAPGISFTEKRKLQKGIQEAMAKLGEKVAAPAADPAQALEKIKSFLPDGEYQTIRDAMQGEEKQFFIDKVAEIAGIIDTMPQVYGQDGKGDDAIIYLHYFRGGSDWYITEKDSDPDGEGQTQAFGYAILNGDKEMAEMGYIIVELVKAGVELDLHWTQTTLGSVKGKKTNPDNAGAPTVQDVGTALEARGWKQGDNGKVWKLVGDKGQYLASGTDSGGGNSGWILADFWDNNAWVPLGGSFSLTGNTADDIVHGIETMIYEHERLSAGKGNQKLADLVAGQYNKESPEVFLKIVKDIITEINDVQPVIEPAVAYLMANQSLISEAAELVFAEVFGKRFEQIRIFEAARASA